MLVGYTRAGEVFPGARMPFLIDGHNLVPFVPGLSLDDPDDEAHLVQRLRQFAARTRRRITVYFDRRAPGNAHNLSGAGVTVRFVAAPETADEAIRRHLERLRREALNWTVVSSDAEVRGFAERAGASWMSAPDFARRLAGPGRPDVASDKPDRPPDSAEVQEWERLFAQRKPGRSPRPR